jgi:polar amino acid transport system substrate-binding protein
VRRAAGLALAALCWAAGAEATHHEGLASVRNRGNLRVCADPSNLPYSSRDPATPGFEVELARLIATELGVEPRMEWTPTYVRAVKPLRDGVCDLFMGLPRDARFREGNPWIAVSRPYYAMRHALVARADAGPLTVSDLSGKRVAVQMASLAEIYINRNGARRGLYKTQEEAFRAVADGDAAAALLWFPVAGWLARQHSDLRVVAVPERELEFEIGAGVRKRDPGLAEAVDEAVGRLVESGRAREVLVRYGAAPIGGAQSRVNGIVPVADKDPVEAGRSLFSTACSRCHGADGVGGGAGGAVPKLRQYEGGEEKFVRVTLSGRKNTAMAGFKGILTEQEVLNIYKYLTSPPAQ